AIKLVNDLALAFEYLGQTSVRSKLALIQDNPVPWARDLQAVAKDLEEVDKKLSELDQRRQGGRLGQAGYDLLFGTVEQRRQALEEQKRILLQEKSEFQKAFDTGLDAMRINESNKLKVRQQS